jgi:hypothetical protein
MTGSANMQLRYRIFRGYTDFDMMHLEQMRAVIKRSRELLANTSGPDTFAGRKTQEPFLQDDELTRMAKRIAAKEPEPPE